MPQPESSKKRLHLRTHLMLLVLAAVLPVVFFAAVLLAVLAKEQTSEIEIGLSGTSRALTSAIDERIASYITSLEIFAAAEDFELSTYPDVHRRISRVAKNQDGWVSIVLARPDGLELLNSARKLGTRLPHLGDETFFAETVKTKRPTVSGFRIGRLTKTKVVSLCVPVLQKEIVKYVLCGSVEAASLTRLINAQNIPADWTAAVLDSTGTIVARSRGAENFVGKKATDELVSRTKFETDGKFEGPSLEGPAAYGVFSHSKLTKWATVLAMPANTAKVPMRQILWTTLGGGALLLAIGIFFALILGRRISQPIVEIAASAAALGRGEPIPPHESSVREIADVAAALEAAGRERNASDRRAQDAILLRDNFLSVASHELKTPLTSLQLHFQLLEKKILRGGQANADYALSFTRILGQIKRLSRLIDELLDVSRIASGRMEMHPEEVELTSLIEEVAAQFDGEKERSGTVITLQLGTPLSGFWDRGRLEQIFTNLISNAVKYGSGNPVSLSISSGPDWATVEVRDQGIGVATADQERIFERFERAAPSENYGGLGLGLWIVRRLVNAQGGDIRVESELGKGSRFFVRLPLKS